MIVTRPPVVRDAATAWRAAATLVVPTPTDQTWLSFHIDRGEAESWPVGIYEVTISLNGQVARQATVEVVAPA